MLSSLAVARADGRYEKVLTSISKLDLLILDDWGLNKLNEMERRDFMEIIDERHDRKFTIFISQVPFINWYELIGDSNIADALMDRIGNSSYRIEMKGESMRKINKKTKDLPDLDE